LVTKSFVGTVILQLAEEGRLSLDDPIDDYVADAPNGTRITLRQLITMTSGLGNYSDDDAWGLAVLGDLEAEWTPEQLLAYSWSMPTSFAPRIEHGVHECQLHRSGSGHRAGRRPGIA
jgi:D-alanyl-D-alanine carboxypeptidase